MDRVAELGGREPSGSAVRALRAAGRQAENALGEVAVRAALEERECAVRETANVVDVRHGNNLERRKLDAEPSTALRQLVEERELQLEIHVVGLDRERPKPRARTGSP